MSDPSSTAAKPEDVEVASPDSERPVRSSHTPFLSLGREFPGPSHHIAPPVQHLPTHPTSALHHLLYCTELYGCAKIGKNQKKKKTAARRHHQPSNHRPARSHTRARPSHLLLDPPSPPSRAHDRRRQKTATASYKDIFFSFVLMVGPRSADPRRTLASFRKTLSG